MWLALASLCVLGPDHVERLSSGEWVSSPDSAQGKPRVDVVFEFWYQFYVLRWAIGDRDAQYVGIIAMYA